MLDKKTLFIYISLSLSISVYLHIDRWIDIDTGYLVFRLFEMIYFVCMHIAYKYEHF